jgi:hypothetical protein
MEILQRLVSSQDPSMRAAGMQMLGEYNKRFAAPTPSEALDLDLKRAQLQQLQRKPDNTVKLGEGERLYQPQVGPDGQSRYGLVAAGDDKLDPHTRGEISKADAAVQSADSSIGQLRTAIDLSKKAYSGVGASWRAGLTDSTIPWATPEASATKQLEQTITSQALESLKSTFGGNPTEGERKILLDIQGSVNQPAVTREAIFNKAIGLIEQRKQFHADSANRLRSGSYYKPGGTPSQAIGAPTSGPEDSKVLNGKRYIRQNGQWYAQ